MGSNNFLGVGIGYSVPSGTRGIYVSVPWTYFPAEKFYLRPTLDLGLENDSGCRSTGGTREECDRSGCQTIQESACDIKGRFNIAGGAGLGYKLLTGDVYSLVLGAEADVGRFFSRESNPHPGFFHSERGVIEFLIHPLDGFYLSWRVAPGTFCEGSDRCRFTTIAGALFGFGL